MSEAAQRPPGRAAPRLPGPPFIGARRDGDRVSFRVWAPDHQRVQVVLLRRDGRGELATLGMEAEPGHPGWFRAELEGAARVYYKYRLDGQGPFPDPASRSQPLGVHGPSEAIDERFAWSDAAWRGVALADLVIYEAHVGTATPEGTFDALAERLPELSALGVTAVELMPLGSFPGRRNWGYDGVSLMAPHAGYGGPAGLRRFVDSAHRAGIAVLVDVVYNHLGPDGNYLRQFAAGYFTARHSTPWGEAVHFAQPGARRLFLESAAMWIRDYHADGLRLDATHAIFDDSEPHVLREIAEVARAAAPDRRVLVIAEDDRNERNLLLPVERGGYGLDAVWADDFHHALRRLCAGDRDGYFEDYQGTAEEVAQALARGWIYEGSRSRHRGGQPRGTSSRDLELPRFVHALQNHDQVGNRALGDRLSAAVPPAVLRAATALSLLTPATPLLFMGQEWSASTPFLYFTDHAEPLGTAVREGRRAEFSRFPAFREAVPDPQADDTFKRSVLRWGERTQPEHAGMLALHRALLAIRVSHPALRARGRDEVESTALGEKAIMVRRKGADGSELLLVVNLAGEAWRRALPGRWRPVLSTEEARFGGEDGARVVGGGGECVVEFGGAAAVLVERALT